MQIETQFGTVTISQQARHDKANLVCQAKVKKTASYKINVQARIDKVYLNNAKVLFFDKLNENVARKKAKKQSFFDKHKN